MKVGACGSGSILLRKSAHRIRSHEGALRRRGRIEEILIRILAVDHPICRNDESYPKSSFCHRTGSRAGRRLTPINSAVTPPAADFVSTRCASVENQKV